MKRVLCIDGGGIRGLLPAAFLERYEAHTRRRIAHQFDMIAGTSTGGLIALYLSVPKRDNPEHAAHSTTQLRQLYLDHAETIFPKRLWTGARQLVAPKYSARGLDHLVSDRLRDAQMSQLVTQVVVPSFDRLAAEDAVFKTSDVVDWYARDAALATSAAPTYFRAHAAQSVGGEIAGSFVDGGIWANNPSLCAYAEAKSLWPGQRIEILSLGTGRRRQTNMGPRSGGLAQWALVLADLFMDSGERGIDYQIRRLAKAEGDTYTRIQTSVPAEMSMDTTSNDHLDLLVGLGHSMAEDYIAGAA